MDAIHLMLLYTFLIVSGGFVVANAVDHGTDNGLNVLSGFVSTVTIVIGIFGITAILP